MSQVLPCQNSQEEGVASSPRQQWTSQVNEFLIISQDLYFNTTSQLFIFQVCLCDVEIVVIVQWFETDR